MGKDKSKIVEESAQTRKTREKIKKKNEFLDQRITVQALEEKAIEIHKWLAKQGSERITLRSKGVCLFDENQNAAEMSRKMQGLADQIRRENGAGSVSQVSLDIKKETVVASD